MLQTFDREEIPLPEYFQRDAVKVAEGYWKSSDEPDLPVPVPHKERWQGQDEFEAKLGDLQMSADEGGYFGCTTSRITGERLGSDEYVYRHKMRWTGDYLSHYIMKHNVKPSKAFYQWVLAEPNPFKTSQERDKAVEKRDKKEKAEKEWREKPVTTEKAVGVYQTKPEQKQQETLLRFGHSVTVKYDENKVNALCDELKKMFDK